MQNQNTRAITQGALMLALFILLFTITMYIPVIRILTLFVVPLPLIWYVMHYERPKAIAVSCIALLMAFIVGNIVGLPFAIIYIILGLIIGDGLRKNKSKLYLLMSTSIAILFSCAIFFIVTTKLLGVNIIAEGIDLLKQSYEQSVQITEEATGQKVEGIDINELTDTIQLSMPASITLSVFFLSFITLSLNLFVLKRLRIQTPTFSAFKDMRLPKAVLWYYLIVLSINLFVNPAEGTTLYVIILNFSMVLWILLTLQGVSLFFYIIEAKKLPKVLKGVAVIFSVPFYSVVVLVGIFDLGFNIRQFIDQKSNK